MFYYEGLSCPVCQKRFDKQDDIVVCPQCGLPHHRECWASVGKCFEAEKHGTDQQWSRKQTQSSSGERATQEPTTTEKLCAKCGASNPQYAEFCKRCGGDLNVEDWHSASQAAPNYAGQYSPFVQPYDAYSSSERIGESNAADLAAFVGNNQPYYLTRFRRIEHTGKGGWNWAAFLLSPFWLFYRKQYLLGFIYFAILMLFDVSYTILYAPLLTADSTSMEQVILEISTSPAFVPVFVLACIYLAMRIVLGIRANNFYLNHCEKKIRKVRAVTTDITPAELASFGGVSMGATVLILCLYYVLSYVLTAFL